MKQITLKRPALFKEIPKGFAFYFGDKPERVLVKDSDTTYVTPGGGKRPIHPHVLVFLKGQT